LFQETSTDLISTGLAAYISQLYNSIGRQYEMDCKHVIPSLAKNIKNIVK